jgi:hypothetical protein
MKPEEHHKAITSDVMVYLFPPLTVGIIDVMKTIFIYFS